MASATVLLILDINHFLTLSILSDLSTKNVRSLRVIPTKSADTPTETTHASPTMMKRTKPSSIWVYTYMGSITDSTTTPQMGRYIFLRYANTGRFIILRSIYIRAICATDSIQKCTMNTEYAVHPNGVQNTK